MGATVPATPMWWCAQLCENVMDPAHLPFTHHQTISKRTKAAPIAFGKLQDFSPRGFSAERHAADSPGRVSFAAPCLVRAETHRGPQSYSDWNLVYAVPTEPGRCRLLVRVVFEVSKLPLPLRWIIGVAFTKLPIWWNHLTTQCAELPHEPFALSPLCLRSYGTNHSLSLPFACEATAQTIRSLPPLPTIFTLARAMPSPPGVWLTLTPAGAAAATPDFLHPCLHRALLLHSPPLPPFDTRQCDPRGRQCLSPCAGAHVPGRPRHAARAAVAAASLYAAVYMPTTSDGMVIAFRRWLDAYTAGEGAPWSAWTAGRQTHAAGALQFDSRDAVLERHESHVAHCSACSGALASMRRIKRTAEAAVAIALLAAGVATRVRAASLVLAALGFATARVCAELEAKMRTGKYPPPRNAV